MSNGNSKPSPHTGTAGNGTAVWQSFQARREGSPSPPASKKGPGSVKKDGGNGRGDSVNERMNEI